ncbi:hypothetical protein [Enterobacter kobei]|uniref:hypothetical protein n=1 Tax=Enterobacter kobei TaxID=208224 RepID=UPI000799C0DE|nr:hypothetical protein [Enterobacter kobei]SAD03433.1 Uncharacterised protein [Enterobacter kobei]
MSTITRERLIKIQQWRETYGPGSNVMLPAEEAEELACIALASLEAEPVCVIDQANLDYLNAGSDADVWPASRTEMGDVLLYRPAPPATANAEPVAWLWSNRKHPSEVTLVRPEDDEKAEGAHWSGWSCQALYAEPPAPVSVPDFVALTKCIVQRLVDYGAAGDDAIASAEEFVYNACRAAMLQGADGNSPVIPDGYALVPVEPTKEMIEAGWSYYMTSKAPGSSGVYSAMLAAAPQQEVKP